MPAGYFPYKQYEQLKTWRNKKGRKNETDYFV